uniref:Uncharacterized protein n=1 Tax=Timspurckia oligopyrenoides TaxID=708627 RepID=A0A7S0ZJT5_9RHOD
MLAFAAVADVCFAQSCDCDLGSNINCPVVQENTVDPDGTVRCIEVIVPTCEAYFCISGGPSFCTVSDVLSLKFNGTADICTLQPAQLISPSLSTIGEILGTPSFRLAGPGTFITSLTNAGFTSGAAGTVYYVKFTTGSDITTSQIIFEDGGTALGLNVQILNGNFNFRMGAQSTPYETIGGVQTNTFYSILIHARPSTGGNNGEYTIWIENNTDILDLTVPAANQVATDTSWGETGLSGGNAFGLGRLNSNALGGITGNFLGTFTGTNTDFQLWSDASI